MATGVSTHSRVGRNTCRHLCPEVFLPTREWVETPVATLNKSHNGFRIGHAQLSMQSIVDTESIMKNPGQPDYKHSTHIGALCNGELPCADSCSVACCQKIRLFKRKEYLQVYDNNLSPNMRDHSSALKKTGNAPPSVLPWFSSDCFQDMWWKRVSGW